MAESKKRQDSLRHSETSRILGNARCGVSPARRVQSARGTGRWPSLGALVVRHRPASRRTLIDHAVEFGSTTRTVQIVSPGCRPKRAIPGVKAGCPASRRQVAADPHGARRTHQCRPGRRNGLRPNKETVDPETVNSGKVGRPPFLATGRVSRLGIFFDGPSCIRCV
jgi:hypothetical protein